MFWSCLALQGFLLGVGVGCAIVIRMGYGELRPVLTALLFAILGIVAALSAAELALLGFAAKVRR
jgi:hypothetical protein